MLPPLRVSVSSANGACVLVAGEGAEDKEFLQDCSSECARADVADPVLLSFNPPSEFSRGDGFQVLLRNIVI